MKIKFVILYVFLFAVVVIITIKVFCNCPDEKFSFGPVSGALTINGSNIDADFQMQVESPDFKYADTAYTIQQNNYKAIIFMYNDRINPSNEDDNVAKDIMAVKFSLPKPPTWKVGDRVRVFYINEESRSNFKGLKSYFEKKLLKFKYKEYSVIKSETFNCDWNRDNPDNPVFPSCCCKGSYVRFIDPLPRYSRDGGILNVFKLMQ